MSIFTPIACIADVYVRAQLLTNSRLSLESIVSALVVLLANIIFNPSNESSKSDLDVSRHMLQILHKLSAMSRDDGLIAIQTLCVELCLKADNALR